MNDTNTTIKYHRRVLTITSITIEVSHVSSRFAGGWTLNPFFPFVKPFPVISGMGFGKYF